MGLFLTVSYKMIWFKILLAKILPNFVIMKTIVHGPTYSIGVSYKVREQLLPLLLKLYWSRSEFVNPECSKRVCATGGQSSTSFNERKMLAHEACHVHLLYKIENKTLCTLYFSCICFVVTGKPSYFDKFTQNMSNNKNVLS